MSNCRPSGQQFSLNSFYGNSGGHLEALRVYKALLGGYQLSS